MPFGKKSMYDALPRFMYRTRHWQSRLVGEGSKLDRNRLLPVLGCGTTYSGHRSYWDLYGFGAGDMLRWLKDKAHASGSTKRMAMIADCRDHFATYQTPFLYAVFYFTLSGDYDFDYRCYQAVLILCYVAGVLGMCHALRYRTEGTLAAALVLIYSYPFLTDVQFGNVNSLQFMLVAL